MNHKPKISVIIPTYNEENQIEEALIAVKKQVCNFSYEIIVTDGQSVDKTVSIAKNYAKVYISPKKGKSNQINFVVPKTKGNLLVFLDADTLIDPYFLQRVYKIFKKNKKLFACSARVKYHDGRIISFSLGSWKWTLTKFFFLNISMHIYYFFKSLLGYPELIGCNIIVRRNIFFKAGGFKQLPPDLIGMDKVFSDSLIYLIRKMKTGKIKTLNFVSVLTSGRSLNASRSLGRITQYRLKKNIFQNLAKDLNWKEQK